MGKNRLTFFIGPVHEPGQMLKCIVAAVGIIGATVALEELLRLFGIANVELALLFMLSTFLIACNTTSYAINISAAIGNAFLYDYFVTAPRLGFSFTLGLPITLVIMLIVSVITSATTTKIKEQMALARQQERRTELMLEINQKMSVSGSKEDIIQIAIDYLSLYEMAGIFYIGDPMDQTYVLFPLSGDQTLPTEGETQRAHACYLAPTYGEKPSAGRYDSRCIPLISSHAPLGVIMLRPSSAHHEKEQIAFAYLLAGQTALAIELKQVMDERTKTLMLAEKEKTRSNLLRAISHDLRTPLTGILSASSIMAEKTGDPLAIDIHKDSEWLIHMVENLLMVTRITDDQNRITKKAELPEEVMARATAIVRKRFPNCNISVKAPKDLAIVPMDGMLMSQVFINLLENAAKHSPANSVIIFELCIKGSLAFFTISDCGDGIPDDLLDNLFGQHPAGNRRSVDSVSGMGLGLSICKTIVEAHEGTISGENKKEGGALFTVCLPLNA